MTRRAGGFLPLTPPDRRSRDPLHLQIASQIADAIRRGAIDAGERLPSTRVLSRFLGVARNTVIAAYDELMAEGVIESRHGAGARITDAAAVSRTSKVRALRMAGYPARTVRITDPDGTVIAISF